MMSGIPGMAAAVEGAFFYVLLAVTLLPAVLWALKRARRALDQRLNGE
jgi:hypothetical protein